MKKFTVKPKTFLSNDINIGLQDETSQPDKLFIGRLAESGSLMNTFLEITSEHVIAIFGKRGSGKSYSLGSLMEGFATIENNNSISKLVNRKAVILFDTLGIFQWMDNKLDLNSISELIRKQAANHSRWNILAEPLNITIFSPSGMNTSEFNNQNPFYLNIADLNAPDWGYLLDLDIYSDKIGQLLNDIFIKITQEGWSSKSKTFRPNVNYSIEEFIDCLQNDKEIETVYHSETKRALLQQFITLSRNKIFNQNGTKLDTLIKSGFLSVLLMHKIPDELRLIIVATLIKKIIEKRINASEREKTALIKGDKELLKKIRAEEDYIPPCWIVIDEAQNLIPSERKNPAGDLLVKLVREGRNFGISFMFTTQQPSAIDQRILSQVDTMFIHRLTVQQDIDYIKRNLKSNLPEEIRYAGRNLSFDEAIRLLDVGQCFVSNTEMERSFFMDIRPRISVHGGF